MKSSDYWIQRALQREADSFQSTGDTLRRLRSIYDDSAARLVRMVKTVLVNFMAKSGVSNEDDAKQLLSVAETASVLVTLREEYLKTGSPEALAKLNAPSYAYRISRLQAVRKAIDAEAEWINAKELQTGAKRLAEEYDNTYYKTMYDSAHAAELDLSFSPLSTKDITEALENRWKGENYSDRVWKNTHLVANEAGRIIDDGLTAGATVQQMSHEIMDLFDVAYYAAARLVRTEINRMHNDSTIKAYKSMGVEWYIYLATLDARTCSVCGALDLKHFRVDDAQTGVNLPPMHPNDRCTTVAYFPGDEITGARTARDPETGKNYKVDRTLSYDEWRKEIAEKYGDKLLENAQKRYRNLKHDAAEQRAMAKVIRKKVPLKIADFQELKYNDPEKWKELQLAYDDKKYQIRIRSDEQNKGIISGRQDKHILGSNNYKPGNSYLTVNTADAQKLVDKYAGRGEVIRDKSGRLTHKELIYQHPENIGVVYDIEGDPKDTNKFIIHYAKDGVHIVPTLREEKKP